MKINLIQSSLIFFFIALLAGCTTPVAVDPVSGQQQNAQYTAGYFYGTLNGNASTVFQTAIHIMDDLGYFRTGELHKIDHSVIYARKVGDEKVTVRITQLSPDQSEVRIRIGILGNLPESQLLYGKIHNTL